MAGRKNPREGYDQVEGRNPVLEALRGPREVSRVCLARGTGRSGVIAEIVSLAERGNIPVVELERAEMSRMARTEAPQGAIAMVAPYRYASLSGLLEGLEGGGVPLVLVLDGVEDPQNFGSLLRVADAAGVDGVVVARRRSCPVTPAVSSSSAGAVEHVRVVQAANIAGALERLKERGLWTVGAEVDAGRPYYEVDFTGPTAVVLGSEGRGLGRLVKERCDFLTRMPMYGRVGSLNVAAAGAVLLYEAARQRAVGGDTRDPDDC